LKERDCASFLFKKLNTNGSVWHDNQTDLMAKLSVVFKKINLILNADITREIESVFKIAQEPGPFTTLIHGDICPDNVFEGRGFCIAFRHLLQSHRNMSPCHIFAQWLNRF
jgi:hypothetical protein